MGFALLYSAGASQGRGCIMCMLTDRMREPAGRMQVKIYCIPERDTHLYIPYMTE